MEFIIVAVLVYFAAKWYFGDGAGPTEATNENPVPATLPRREVKIAGTSHYQDAISAVVGRRRPGGHNPRMVASLVCDAAVNPYDVNAVKVLLEARHVGHPPKDDARSLAPAVKSIGAALGHPPEVPCRVVGGGEERTAPPATSVSTWDTAGLNQQALGRLQGDIGRSSTMSTNGGHLRGLFNGPRRLCGSMRTVATRTARDAARGRQAVVPLT
jgi:hypothetical protein